MAARRLVRSETDKVIAGVCGGLAEYFGTDPTLIRVLTVVAGIMGWGLLAYIVLWIVVPKASKAGPAGPPPPPTRSNALHIAEERYARGEISADELAKIRTDLQGG